MATLEELKELLMLVQAAQDGAIELRLKHQDEVAEFESILNPLHRAANKLTSLVKP
jgi:hypothetical protein